MLRKDWLEYLAYDMPFKTAGAWPGTAGDVSLIQRPAGAHRASTDSIGSRCLDGGGVPAEWLDVDQLLPRRADGPVGRMKSQSPLRLTNRWRSRLKWSSYSCKCRR